MGGKDVESKIQQIFAGIQPPNGPKKILDALTTLLANPVHKVPFETSESAQAIIRQALQYLRRSPPKVTLIPGRKKRKSTALPIRQGICALLIGIHYEMEKDGHSFIMLFGEIPYVRGSDTWDPTE